MSNIALKVVNAWIWSRFPLPWEVFFNDNSLSAWYFLFETNGEQFQYYCNRIMMALMWVCDRMQVYFSLFYVSELLFSPLYLLSAMILILNPFYGVTFILMCVINNIFASQYINTFLRLKIVNDESFIKFS